MSSNPLIQETIELLEKDEKLCKQFNNNYVEIIKFHIRNIRIMNERQMKYIKTLPHDTKNELFEIYNDCIRSFNDIMLNDDDDDDDN